MRTWKEDEVLKVATDNNAAELIMPSGDMVVIDGRRYDGPIHYQEVTFKFGRTKGSDFVSIKTHGGETKHVEVPVEGGDS